MLKTNNFSLKAVIVVLEIWIPKTCKESPPLLLMSRQHIYPTSHSLYMYLDKAGNSSVSSDEDENLNYSSNIMNRFKAYSEKFRSASKSFTSLAEEDIFDDKTSNLFTFLEIKDIKISGWRKNKDNLVNSPIYFFLNVNFRILQSFIALKRKFTKQIGRKMS